MNTVGSYKCGCRAGYRKGVNKNDERCYDIDECVIRGTCPYSSVCENTEGGYNCVCNNGFHGRNCSDVDECLSAEHKCDNNADCANTFGSYDCACRAGLSGTGKHSECKCGLGFFPNESSICVDENECTSNTHECDRNAECFNTEGTYSCSCNKGYYGSGLTCVKGQCDDSSCPDNQSCISPRTIQCTCNDGFVAMNESCVDINECLEQTFTCHENSDCMNTVGTYKCECIKGFIGDGTYCERGTCDNTICPQEEKKICSSLTSTICKCSSGFEIRNDTCVDFNECKSSALTCEMNSKCVNSVGSYQCVCLTGYQGESNCTNIDECELGTHECEESKKVCVDEIGGYQCNCKTGYNQDENGNCVDIDECKLDPNLCDSCINVMGSYGCQE